MKYILYARKSSEDKQKQIQSIPDQLKLLKALAIERGIEIVEIITDEKTARKPGREGFNKMIDMIERGEVDGILCWKLDRLARNLVDGGGIINYLQIGAIQNILTPDKSYFPETNTMLMCVEFGLSTQQSRDLSVNVKRGMDSKVDKGWYPGKAPIGYTNDRYSLKGEKKILKDASTFETIKHLWQVLLKDELQLMELYRYMKKHAPIYKNGTIISTSTFCRIFHHKFYAGLFKWGDWHIGKHEAMITLSQYELAQNILSSPAKIRKRKNQFELKGLFKCATCDAWITAEQHTKRIKKTGEEKTFVYYRCGHRKKGFDCKEKPISNTKIQDFINKELDDLYLPQELLDFGINKLKAVKSDDTVSQKEQTVKRELSDTKKKIKQLRTNIAYETDKDTKAIVKEELTRQSIVQRSLEEQLQDMKKKN